MHLKQGPCAPAGHVTVSQTPSGPAGDVLHRSPCLAQGAAGLDPVVGQPERKTRAKRIHIRIRIVYGERTKAPIRMATGMPSKRAGTRIRRNGVGSVGGQVSPRNTR